MVLLIPSKKNGTNNCKAEKGTLSTSSFEKILISDEPAPKEEHHILSSSSSKSDLKMMPFATHSSDHWSENVYECSILSHDLSNASSFLGKLKGGSDNNQFVYLDSSVFATSSTKSPIISQYDIVLEVKTFKISGYTHNDVIKLIEYLAKSDEAITFRTVKSQLSAATESSLFLPLELNKFLEEPFQKGSVEYDLQQTIRDNVYERTVPCTTRPPRTGEIHGQDYVFLSNDEFLFLKNNALLLECGFYNGYMYGTPIPPAQPKPLNDKPSNLSLNGQISELIKESRQRTAPENEDSKQEGSQKNGSAAFSNLENSQQIE